jgi:hypothetical protein
MRWNLDSPILIVAAWRRPIHNALFIHSRSQK